MTAQGVFHAHGYIQSRYTDQDTTRERLEVHRARVILSGDPLPRLACSFQADLVKQPYLMDAALTWKFSRELRLTAGQFKIPFRAESLAPDNFNIPIARARAVNPWRRDATRASKAATPVCSSLERLFDERPP